MKYLKKISLLVFSIIVCFGLFVFFSNPQETVVVQCENPVRLYQKDSSIDFDSLRDLYAQNKSFIKEYEKQSLIALSYYPELKNCSIQFEHANIKTTMACRPSVQRLVCGHRVYQIFINDYLDFEGVLLQDVPFNAQIGIIGHEMAHILDYEERNIAGIIQRSIDYLFVEKKRKYEREIDSLTIKQGLGWQLYDWANFSMYHSTKATEKYKQFKQDIYMSPLEIEDAMKTMDCYHYTIDTK
jgi:hypothetical protein